jgi:hypothetical protein
MIEFDRGPSTAFAQHLANAPRDTAAQRRLFWYDWGPVFYRGRVGGSARLLGIASDPGPTEWVACRTLVGDAGQRVQGFLSKLGLTRSCVLVNAHPFALHPGKANRAKPLLAKPAHRDWRNGFYDAIAGPKLQAVVAFGDQAQEALRLWGPPNGVEPFEVQHPSSHNETVLLNEWRDAIAALGGIVTPDSDGTRRSRATAAASRSRIRTHPARRPALRAGGVVRRRRLGSPGHGSGSDLRIN